MTQLVHVSSVVCKYFSLLRVHRNVSLLDWSNWLPCFLHPSQVNWMVPDSSGRRFSRDQLQLWQSSHSFKVSFVSDAGVADSWLNWKCVNRATASFSWLWLELEQRRAHSIRGIQLTGDPGNRLHRNNPIRLCPFLHPSYWRPSYR